MRDELRVKEVEFGDVEATELRVKPNLPVLGPKLGKELGAVRAALAAGEFEELDGRRLPGAGHELGPDEVLVERSGREGWAVASEDGVTVALDTSARRGARARGPRLRPDPHAQLDAQGAGPRADRPDRGDAAAGGRRPARRHADWIKAEVLAVSLETDGVAEPQIAKVSHEGRRRIDR